MNPCLKTGLAFKDVDSNRVYHGDLFFIEGHLRIHGVAKSTLDKPVGMKKGQELLLVSSSERFMMTVSLASSARQERVWPDKEGVPTGWVDFTDVFIISVTDAFREAMERINPTWVKKHAEDYEWWFE